jgi:hypothetical protein
MAIWGPPDIRNGVDNGADSRLILATRRKHNLFDMPLEDSIYCRPAGFTFDFVIFILELPPPAVKNAHSFAVPPAIHPKSLQCAALSVYPRALAIFLVFLELSSKLAVIDQVVNDLDHVHLALLLVIDLHGLSTAW